MSSPASGNPATLAAVAPGSILDARDALALNLHASPGSYALLLWRAPDS